MKGLKFIFNALMAILVISFAVSCHGTENENGKKYDRVLILYSAGFNSLSSYLREDIGDIADNYLPKKNGKDVMVVVSHLPKSYGVYSEKTHPYIFRMYQQNGVAVMDTLCTMDIDARLTDPSCLSEALTFISEEFPSDSYGLFVTSHGTGWLPEGYYNDPSKYEPASSSDNTDLFSRARNPQIFGDDILNRPLDRTKSITQGYYYEDDVRLSEEMDIDDFAAAIPMHLDYLVMDVCLAGGIEMAYSMKDICDHIVFSPSEILADGYNYTGLTSYLIYSDTDIVGYAKSVFDHYDELSGNYRSALVACVSTSGLDELASVCKTLFSKYRDAMAEIDPDEVQGFFRFNRHFYYDLVDILDHAGISDEDMNTLQTAVDNCIEYKGATPDFLGAFTINTYCGFSMYLPCDGTDYLNSYYKNLNWNKATGLVE